MTLSVTEPINITKRYPMNLALLGLDTSHGPAFARILKEKYPQHTLAGAWPGGTESIPASRDRVEGFTREVEALGVPIRPTVEAAAADADAVFILTLDADTHGPLLSAIARPGLQVFIDKPLAYSTAEANGIFKYAGANGTEVFSASALRFLPDVQRPLLEIGRNQISRLLLRTPLNPQIGIPRYHFYAIHAAEILVTLLGPEITTVRRMDSENAECFSVTWKSGATAELELTTKPGASFDLRIESRNGDSLELLKLERSVVPLYQPLLEACMNFFEDGKVPVGKAECLASLKLLELLET